MGKVRDSTVQNSTRASPGPDHARAGASALSTRVRGMQLFAASWILFTVFFATNIEREHYTAFALVDDQTLKVDEWVGFHPDIFVHTDGHAYVGNNVSASFFAAVPLAVFDPVLDRLQSYGEERLAAGRGSSTEYRTFDHHQNRKAFWELVSGRGLELRFGATAAITTAFLMAPLSALMLVLLFRLLVGWGIDLTKATELTLLFGFGTPILLRSSVLSHNMFVLYATFASFYVLWSGRGPAAGHRAGRLALAGLLAGMALAFDYSGMVPLVALYVGLVVARVGRVGFWPSVHESLPFIAGSVPAVLLLIGTQWIMYGHPFLPGQYWMPEVNFTDRGFRGFSWPNPELFFLNLFEPRWGMLVFGPLLALGLIPFLRRGGEPRVPRSARRLAIGLTLAIMIFTCANQYSYMQWNTGFRYMLLIVPFMFLLAVDHLIRLPRPWFLALSSLFVAHSWVLASFREAPFFSWGLLFERGIQLPWLSVIKATRAPDTWIFHPMLPTAVLLVGVGVAVGAWLLVGRLRGRKIRAARLQHV